MRKSTVTLTAVALMIGVAFLFLLENRKHQPEKRVVKLSQPAFDSLRAPVMELRRIAEQWQRLQFLHRETAYRWDPRARKRVRYNRVFVPYDSRVESNPVRYLFRNILASSSLKTGILLDACPAFSPGVHGRRELPTDLTNLSTTARLLSACVDKTRNPLSDFERMLREANRYYHERGVLPVIILDMEAERLRPEAIRKLAIDQQGAFVLTRDSLPFERSSIFMAAPLVREIGYRHVRLVVDPNFVLTNRGKPDFYTVSINGQPLVRKPLGLAVSFDFSRAKENVRIRIGLGRRSAGVVGMAQVGLQSTLVPAYDLTWIPSCHPVGSQGEDVWIHPYVFFGANHATGLGTPEIQHPFVILGGYDQSLFGNYSRMYAAIAGMTPGSDFIRQLRAQFDVILLEYSDVGVPLELNAQALACVILDINQRNQDRDGIVFVGISMGGLVSRLTLAGMENRAIPGISGDHRVRFWATIDTPHQGAHIPLGLQFLADHFSWLPTDEIARVNGLMNSPAAREMLIEHHDYPESVSPARLGYLATLRSWGSFPKKIGTTVALSSGALAYGREDQSWYFEGNDCSGTPSYEGCVFQSPAWQPLPNNVLLVQGNSNSQYYTQDNRNGTGGLYQLGVAIDANYAGLNGSVWLGVYDRTVQDRRVLPGNAGVGDGSQTAVFHSAWEIYVLPDWAVAFIDNPSGQSTIKLNYGTPYSLMAGGWLSTGQDIFDGLSSAGIGAVHGPLIPGVSGAPMPRHTFVPVWSALDISPDYLNWMWGRCVNGDLWHETWYGANTFPPNAMTRGYFSYADFVDFDHVMWDISRPWFTGRVSTTTISVPPCTPDPVYVGEEHCAKKDIRPSPFDWIYFNKGWENLQHGQIDAAGIQFLLSRLGEELSGAAHPITGPPPPPPTGKVLLHGMPGTLSLADLLQRFISGVQGLALSQSTTTTLVGSLQTALQAVQNGDNASAVASLQRFIADVEARRGTELTDQQANDMIADANRLISALT